MRATVIGDCEVCDKTQIEVWNMQGNILMCADCRADELKVVEQASDAAKITIQTAKAIDTSVEVKTDIFNTATVSAVELHGAIMANTDIADADKDYAYTKACQERLEHFSRVAFDAHEAYIAAENVKRAWQTQTQTAAGKIRDERREHFKNLNMNYAPQPVKSIKPATPKQGKKAFNLDQIKAAASKYGVDMVILQMTMQKKIFRDVEQAAKALAGVK